MIKTEIKDFFVDFADEKAIPATLPMSVYQVAGDKKTDTVRLYTTINVDENMLAGGYIYLKIKDLRHSASVSLNGRAIGMPTAEEPVYSYDVKDRLTVGDNLLQITFEGEPEELLSAGIFGGVDLVRFTNRMIDTLVVESTREGNDVTVSIRLNTVGSDDAVRAVATLVSGSGQIYYAGLTKGYGKITVKDPLLWWPKGVGIQNLYKLTVNLYGESEIEDTAEMRIGFASLTTDGGVTEVNGEPFIPLGAVYNGLAAARTPSAEKAAIGAYMSALCRAGVNTLIIPERVGRISDAVYDLCDLYGITAVHEISSLSSLIKSSLLYQGYRPSVGMIDLVGDGDDLEKITESLRLICSKTDINCHEKTEYTAFYSLPAERTIREIVPCEERNPFSAYLDPIKDEMIEIISRSSNEYPYASDLSSLAYVSGLSGALETEKILLSERVSSRRAIYDSRIAGRGLLSSGMLDTAYRSCALYYHLSRSYAGTVLYAIGDGTKIDFFIARSERSDLAGTAELRILDRDGNCVFAQTIEVSAPKTSVTKMFQRDFAEQISGRERELYLEYTLKDETGVLSRRTYLFCEIRKYKFAKPHIETEIVGTDKRFVITVTSDSFATGVEIMFDMDGVFLSDNFFDIGAGAKHKIVINSARSTSKELLYEAMRIRSVNELAIK